MVDDDPDKILTPEEMMQDTTAHEDEVDAKVRFATSGIIITGQDSTTRAMSTFHGSAGSGATYVGVVNKYKEMLGSRVNVWCMPIPTAIEYYCPSSVASRNKSQRAMIENMMSSLVGAKGVNICDVMASHKREDIYLRTDHHWAPLGGFYAAQAFAKAAGVPFRGLDAYEKRVVPGYVGSMFGYSKDINVKKNPEDFVYYVPTGATYTTTFITYYTDEDLHVTGESKPFQASFFKNYKGNNAYLNFMGTDCTLVKVQTGVNNGRRLLIMKDSFGNTLPGYMFYSFEEVHVVDYRYFTKNILKYIDENKITDILFANNTFAVCTSYTSRSYSRFLTTAGGYTLKPVEEKQAADTVKKDEAKTPEEPEKASEEEEAPAEQEPVKEEEPVKEVPGQEPAEKPDTLA
ncbi:MAG: DHHW family protein [Bacteroidales bacterium]|nr:DHHW family protein [Bacteroidales bacterium]